MRLCMLWHMTRRVTTLSAGIGPSQHDEILRASAKSPTRGTARRGARAHLSALATRLDDARQGCSRAYKRSALRVLSDRLRHIVFVLDERRRFDGDRRGG